MTIVMPHWSATRFTLFEQCRAEFKARYVDGVALEPSEPLAFGKAVHLGLETHYLGGDGEHIFRRAWQAESRALNGQVSQRLTAVGLGLLDKIYALDLKGIPERPFSLDTEAELGAPIVGALDLYDPDSHIVYDFKTTRGRWSQERAQSEAWQPLLYTWSIWEETSDWPSFEYVVANRFTGELSRFRREWTPDQWLAEMNALWSRMCSISVAVAHGELECAGTHGLCPECGERWSHQHVCDEHAPRLRVGGRLHHEALTQARV